MVHANNIIPPFMVTSNRILKITIFGGGRL
nr:MAG TPA: hypothetical protein [Siphoviridae sp. ct5YG1]